MKKSAAAEAAETPAAKPKKKPGIITLMVLFSTALLLASALLTFLAYRLIVEPFYVQLLQQQLSEMERSLIDAQFDEAVLQNLQTDIRVFVLDKESGEITYVDNYFHGESLPDSVSVATPPEKPANEEEMEARRELEAADLLVLAVDYTLEGQEGSYFAADNWGRAPNGMPLESKALYLNGLHGGHYYSLCLTVESVNASLTLALRFSMVITAIVWLLGMLFVSLFYRRLTNTSRAVVDAAERLSNLDFSVRCPEAISREFDALASSANKMADQMKQNLSELRQTNDRLSEELAESARQHELTRELIGNLSHDLKTPIAIISGYAEGLTEGVAKTDAQRSLYAEMILQESENMQGIVSNMLALTRLAADQRIPDDMDFDLSELVSDVIAGFSRELEKEGLSFETKLQPALLVRSDYASIRQVVVNYVQNAIYHRNGGNILRAVTESDGAEAVFRIANSSAPIVGENAVKIWEKLYRIDRARSQEHGEAGLGLSIVKGNMEKLGLPYGFRNLEGENIIEFYIQIPLA